MLCLCLTFTVLLSNFNLPYHLQPALLYIVPAVVGFLAAHCIWNGDVKQVRPYSKAPRMMVFVLLSQLLVTIPLEVCFWTALSTCTLILLIFAVEITSLRLPGTWSPQAHSSSCLVMTVQTVMPVQNFLPSCDFPENPDNILSTFGTEFLGILVISGCDLVQLEILSTTSLVLADSG